MRATRESRSRDNTARTVLAALADRPDEGMTVFELRAKVDADIDAIEDALADLKESGEIEVRNEGRRTVIVPDERALDRLRNGREDEEDEESGGWLDEIRRRLPF
jgi:hypothetical protein